MKFILIICNISVLCVCFWSCVAESAISIHKSQYQKSWNKAFDLDRRLLDFNYIKENGWRPILHVIPENEEFWIAATATPTPFVSWEGCVRWLGGRNCTKEKKRGGSIADCLQECPEYPVYILLQDKLCRCIAKDKAETCFELTNIHNCKVLCLNNGNDRCGGAQSMFLSVYFRDQFPTELNKENGNTHNCVHASRKNLRTTLAATKSCYENFTRRYICNGSIVENGGFLSWPQAFDKCGEQHAQLGFEQINIARGGNNYWTSLRRSFEIDWMPQIDNTSHKCVTVKKDSVHQLVVQTDDCTQSHRYLYLQLHQADISDELAGTLGGKEGSQEYLWQLGVFVVFAICVITVSVICYCNGLKRQEQRRSRSLGAAGVRKQAVQPNEEPRCPQESRPIYYSSVTLNRYVVDNIMSGQPQSEYNKISSVQKSNISIYDRTLTSRQPLLTHCPENEYGFGAQTTSEEVPTIREEDQTFKYAVPKKRKYAPRNLRETDATLNADLSAVSEEVPSVEREISTRNENDPTKVFAFSTTDCSKNVPNVSETTCNSQTRSRLLISEMEVKMKNHYYYKLEAME